MTEAPKFYLTSPIYYVNARPHIGHAYTTIAADVMARHKRAQGYETWFLTGTDEHGQKIERSAAKAGKSPQAFADEVSGTFRSLWDRMGISYDDFVRTTEERHKRGVQKLFEVIQERGFIYKGSYSGQYCVSDELYVDAPPGSPCPDCGRMTETVSEENYFFKLSAFERKLLEFYEQHPQFIRPESRRNEVLSFVRGGLKDLSISRTGFHWGIPVPGDEKHVIYVWMDALANYMTAIGYGSDRPEDQARFTRFWPADVHIIGKEISRFHCVYWPAFLMAAGLPLPKSVIAHGWLLFEESKMSKSLGNIVRPEAILDAMNGGEAIKHGRGDGMPSDALGSDALRYYLLREVGFGHDGNFSLEALVQRYNADLANGYGNLTSRTVAMITRYFSGEVPAGAWDEQIAEAATKAAKLYLDSLDAFDFSRALEALWSFVATVDRFITERAPWKLASSSEAGKREELAGVLATCAEALRMITALVFPVLPYSSAKVWEQLGLGNIRQADLKNVTWGQPVSRTRLGEPSPVFPRAEKDVLERMQEFEKNDASPDRKTAPSPAEPRGTGAEAKQAPAAEPAAAKPAPAKAAPSVPQPPTGKISIEDFAKVELRVAVVKTAERVKGADRLLRLEVDLGGEMRQIVAGIAEAYSPEALLGRNVVIVANLEPRKLRGLESNGMIVAASLEGGKPVLAGFLEDVPAGARLK